LNTWKAGRQARRRRPRHDTEPRVWRVERDGESESELCECARGIGRASHTPTPDPGPRFHNRDATRRRRRRVRAGVGVPGRGSGVACSGSSNITQAAIGCKRSDDRTMTCLSRETNLDGLAVDDELVTLVVDRARVAAVHGVVLEHVLHVVGRDERVVDRDDLDVREARERAHDQAARRKRGAVGRAAASKRAPHARRSPKRGRVVANGGGGGGWEKGLKSLVHCAAIRATPRDQSGDGGRERRRPKAWWGVRVGWDVTRC
jgi:hypothetical protein